MRTPAQQLGTIVLQSPKKLLLNLKEVGEHTGFTPKTIRQWIREGTFPKGFRVDGEVVWLNRDITIWAEYNAMMRRGEGGADGEDG